MSNNTRALFLSSLLLCLCGCWSSDTEYFWVEVEGEVESVAAELDVYVSFFLLSIGEGILQTDAVFLEEIVLPGGGPLAHNLRYPVEDGTGLLIFGWVDADGDGDFCAPGSEPEASGAVVFLEPTSQPVTGVALSLGHLCVTADELAAQEQ